jgi:hexosaminidase
VTAEGPGLLPRPWRVRRQDGAGAELADGMAIAYDEAPGFAATARWFRRALEAATGWRVEVRAGAEQAEVELRQGEVDVPAPGPAAERYRLVVGGGRIVVTAPADSGAFYGLQTLRQLLPPDCYRHAPAGGGARPPFAVGGVEVEDGPRFEWRGVHLDVCRHFMPLPFVLRLVDLAALHKLNVFHLHLTEDQGWRVPIPKYPRLVEVGAWRRESSLGHARDRAGDGVPHGGFYTRADLEEIVGYAAERHVTVVPEVDMPGHMVAAIAAYPWLGNTGEQREVLTHWGISRHVLNLEEPTLQFCRDVIDEVADIFPGGGYFHIGGDECPTEEWEESPSARALMESEGLSEPRQLQGWFTARMAEHLRSIGRRLVGWDEILEGGAPPGAVVMSWRGEAGGIAAASAGHDVVMTPEEWLYLDWAYADDPAEPLAIRPAISVERVYGYDPVASIPADRRHHVLGVQANLWTEYVPTPEHAEYLYFPRLCALAEVAWSATGPGAGSGSGSGAGSGPAGGPSFGEFEPRLRAHLERLAALGVNYRPLEGPTPGQSRVWRPLPPAPAPPDPE